MGWLFYKRNLNPVLAVKPFEYIGFEGIRSAIAPVPIPPNSI